MFAYSFIKFIHIALVILSITGFVFRGYLKMIGSEKLSLKFFRVFPHIVDSLLLLSALILVVISGMYPWRVDWLGAKLVALLAYIFAGAVMMHSGPDSKVKYLWFVVALSIASYIVMVEITKSPLPIL